MKAACAHGFNLDRKAVFHGNRFAGGRPTVEGEMRVRRHPVLGDADGAKRVTIFLDGKPVNAREGEPVAAALYAAGRRVTRYTKRGREARGPFCMIGRCTECSMILEGVGMVRTCITPVREGMRIRTPGGREG